MAECYRLGSNPMFFTPGVLRWAMAGYNFPDQRKTMVKLFVDGFNLPKGVAEGLLSGKIPHRVEGDVVVVGGER